MGSATGSSLPSLRVPQATVSVLHSATWDRGVWEARTMRRLTPWTLLMVLGLGAGAGAGLGIASSQASSGAHPAATSGSPANAWLVGLSLTRAEAVAGREGVNLSIISAPSHQKQGQVIGQDLNLKSDETIVVSTGPLHNDEQILPLASVPPVSRECASGLVLAEDGNAGPLTCKDGGVNVGAWDYYASLKPLLMELTRNATPQQVTSAICTPESLTAVMKDSTFQLAEAYYGWHFGEQFLLDRLYGLHGQGCASH